MLDLQLQEITEAVQGKILQGNPRQTYNTVTIDSRRVKPGDIFIAIVGENNDGHDYIPEAVERGAKAVITSRRIEPYSRVAIILVRDTTAALQDLALYNRQQLKDLKVIGVTGSAGKTTTKDMIYSLIRQERKVLRTRENYNNEYGLPLCLLDLEGDEDVAVLEMATRHIGDIRLLARIALPQIGVITNIGPAHVENLGSIKNVARAKQELLEELRGERLAILNFDNREVRNVIENFSREKGQIAPTRSRDLNIITYSLEEEQEGRVDYFAGDIDFFQEEEKASFSLKAEGTSLPLKINRTGIHDISNALAAIAAARAVGVSWGSIAEGLKNIQITDLRQEIRKLNGIKIINDTYNANPLSMKAGIDSLVNMASGRKIAVLGAMLELGPIEQAAHREIGKYLVDKGLDLLIVLGKTAEEIAEGALEAGMPRQFIYAYQKKDDITGLLRKIMHSGDTILIKGSRSLEMEEIVDVLLEQGGR